jgi:hypothetical protein
VSPIRRLVAVLLAVAAVGCGTTAPAPKVAQSTKPVESSLGAAPGTPATTVSTAPTTQPSTPTSHARVLSLDAAHAVTYGIAGPSIARDGSGQLTKYPALTAPVKIGSYLDVICTLYGQSTNLGSLGVSNIWDYTAAGWFTNQALLTSSPYPVANECVGNIAHPNAGTGLPSATEGPFPIYSRGKTVIVGSDPQADAGGALLRDGDLVTLVCTENGPLVLSPNDLTGQPIGSSIQWDRISSPFTGWVPDAMVNSASEDSVAPACPVSATSAPSPVDLAQYAGACQREFAQQLGRYPTDAELAGCENYIAERVSALQK